jgi:hypothetical protein
MPADDRALENLLDAAGRAVQPSHPGWQQLGERLARTPQLKPRPRHLRWINTGLLAAAVVFLCLLLGLVLLINPPHIIAGPIEVQRLDIDLTILSAADTDGETLYMPLLQRLGAYLAGGFVNPPPQSAPKLTGQALVKDHRLILNLKKGDNTVRFTDIAASIDPTSVRFVSTTDPAGTQVIEQNFEYDLASAGALLQRFLERPIVCIGKDGQGTYGVLVSHDEQNVVLATAPAAERGQLRTTQTIARNSLQAIRLDEVPPDLLVKPTLVWKLRTQKPGQHDTTLSYLCGQMKWQADYVAVVTPGANGQPDLIDFTGWVSLDNTSGATYPKAGLKLIAGDVNRVRDPWAPVPPPPMHLGGGGNMPGPAGPPDEPLPKVFIEASFFEYHLYTLTAPSTVRDRESKQLNLLHRDGIKAQRRYVFESPEIPPPDWNSRVAIELVAKNEKENGLGLPLPKGRVRFEQRDLDGETALLGTADIDHTPVKEELTLRYGYAFDVVGEASETARNQYRIVVRNHKNEEIQVRAVATLALGHSIAQASLPLQMHDAQTGWFDFVLKANAEQEITYTVREQ